MNAIGRNWAGNYIYSAARFHHPKTVEQVQEVVKRCVKLRAMGTRHSFNGIADCAQDMISLEHLDRVVKLDSARRTVTVESGVRYGQLGQYLHERGFALRNLASLPHISIAGACATATHGSGEKNGNLATEVAAMELVGADGEVSVVSREQDGQRFNGMVVSLGALGVITKLTLDVVPTFTIRQDVYENLPLAQAQEHFDEIESAAYSVSLFTDWRNESISQVWLKSVARDNEKGEFPTTFFGAKRVATDRHPIAAISPVNCTTQRGIPGPWHERLPHFRMDYTPSSGEELQSEYFVPRPHAVAALGAIARLREHIAPLLLICEVRTVAAEDLWLSPCYRQPCATFHFTWKQDWPAVQKVLAMIEEQLAPFNARPHWGKLFLMPPGRAQSFYEKLPDFQQLLRSYDPQGKFRNAFLETYIAADT